MKSWLLVLPVMVVGGLSGFSGAVLAGRLTPKVTVVPSSAPPPSVPRVERVGGAPSCALRAIAPPNTPPGDASVTPPPQEQEGGRVPSAEQAAQDRATERELQRKRMEAHLQEPRDSAWASGLEASLSESFEQLRESSPIKYSELECRYLSCKAKLEWPDSASAEADLGKVASLHNGLPCSRLVVLDEMAPGRNETTGTVIFDCQESRLGK